MGLMIETKDASGNVKLIEFVSPEGERTTGRRDRVSREQFEAACEAIWLELNFQDGLLRRPDEDGAKDVPGFLTLARRYIRKTEDAWSDDPGVEQFDGQIQVTEALRGLRKLAAIFVRAMIHNGVRIR